MRRTPKLPPASPALTHLDAAGAAHMVNIGDKLVTSRTATAAAVVGMNAEAARALHTQSVAKGDAIAVARVAGILAVKRTAELIPLCHPLSIRHVAIEFELRGNQLHIACTCSAEGKTGVEMEALTGASVAALTIYDMLKSVDRSIQFTVALERKSGGSRGDYLRASAAHTAAPRTRERASK
jgi:cyclic pyranopterin monophosphate synthase